MNDELLMRVMDGTATPEEVETVMEMLSRDDDAAKEWVQMVQGARLADSSPAVEIHEGEVSEFVSSILNAERKKGISTRRVIKLPWILGGVVAVAAALAMFVVLPTVRNAGGSGDGFVADIPQDTAEIVEQADTMHIEAVSPEVKEYRAEAVALKTEKLEAEKISDVEEVKSDEMISETAQVQGHVHHDDVSTAAGMKINPTFRMVRPAKTPYRVRVKDAYKEFVFEWEASGEKSVELSVSDSKGNVVLKELIEDGICQYPVKAYDVTDRGQLVWRLKVSYENGFEHIESGDIEFVSAQ